MNEGTDDREVTKDVTMDISKKLNGLVSTEKSLEIVETVMGNAEDYKGLTAYLKALERSLYEEEYDK